MRFCLFTILVELQSCVYTETVPVCLSVYFRPLFLLPVCLNATVSFRVLLPLCLHVCLLISFRLYLSSSPPLPDYISICFCLFCPIFSIVCVPVYLLLFLSTFFFLFIYLSVYVHLSLSILFSLFARLSVYLHLSLSVFFSLMPVCLFVTVCLRLVLRLSFACLSICHCLSLSSSPCLPVSTILVCSCDWDLCRFGRQLRLGEPICVQFDRRHNVRRHGQSVVLAEFRGAPLHWMQFVEREHSLGVVYSQPLQQKSWPLHIGVSVENMWFIPCWTISLDLCLGEFLCAYVCLYDCPFYPLLWKTVQVCLVFDFLLHFRF